MRDRVKRMFGKAGKPLDAMVFVNSVEPHLDQTFFYVTDVPSGLFEGCTAVAFPDGRVEMFTSELEAESARAAPDVNVNVFTTRDDQAKQLQKLLGSSGKIGLNFHEITYESFLGLKKEVPQGEWSDVSEAIRRTRVVKDAKEIERLRAAGRIGTKVAEEIPKMLKVGMTELELAAEMEHRMNLHGAAGRSFGTIVAFGAHGAEPHFSPTDTKLAKGTTMVCDFGALYQRYCSDITRSYAFGRPPADRKAIHDKVEEAQRAAFDAIRAGVPAKEPHLAAAKVIDSSPWKGRFIHGLGHSIGLAVHDGFGMNGRNEELLEEGMCLTVEPGIYVPGVGGVRIEDDILVTKKGYEPLTTAPRGYLEVGR
ncbi:MAG: aminopeptidase P family protein [Euryarchaeota archaeon]|nr:aminopeptidase P family protein [Euryarchaeota archaeon]MDE1836327.1 aminopeptidase P family protein [Euryarchaeota archaeon]MDE1879125.1 aminopeptidase P family protein [Euryarchaeota archaeon]MDE2044277.1 aminopeptidase P family protein [Thermoplasmata archaeon]